MKLWLHFNATSISRLTEESRDRWGLMIKPPVLKIRSPGADDAGTKRTCIASLYKAGRWFSMVSQTSKIFSLKCSPLLVISRYFSNCHRTLVDFLEVALFGIFEYLLKRRGMFLSCAVSSSERPRFANSDVLPSTSISSIKFSAARIIFSAKNI